MPLSRRTFLEGLTLGSGLLSARDAFSQTQRQWTPNWISGQPEHALSSQAGLSLQPLAAQVREIESALAYLGEPLASEDHRSINDSLNSADESSARAQLQQTLDRHALVIVRINAESRVQVEQGSAHPELIEAGTRLFLVKVLNEAGVTAALQVKSPNSQPVYVPAWRDESPEPSEHISVEEVRNRWADISLYTQQPVTNQLSGLPIQYAILQIYSRDAGQRSARISFDVGQGTEDIGAGQSVDILFNARPARTIRLQVLDADAAPTFASLLIHDKLKRIHPNPSKRLAPDFFFQPQIYRGDGEQIRLPDGAYRITFTGGPEYLEEVREIEIRGEPASPIPFRLKRWIHPARMGWHPGDHHIHAAGCSHYVTPSEGVDPAVMMRQVQGEHLSIGCVLNWAPCYYHQKQFFSGRDDPLSKPGTILHYDLEISGFPSSHCGHLVLLGLKEQNFPGAQRIEDWPTWNLPILQWAKTQGAVAGYAHSGWGLAVKSKELPNYEIPAFDGIGANEFIVDVTHPNAVDFMSAGDTPYVWELNIWYHTLNVGFRARLSGETDFPCITDNRVGQSRLYAKVDGELTYRSWLQSLQQGRSYVSNGKSHLIDFAVNGSHVGLAGSEVVIAKPESITVSVSAAAHLNDVPDESVSALPYDKAPYWDLERARIGKTREVFVELIWNGRCVAKQRLLADGSLRSLHFSLAVQESGWAALRILPSAHTNPIFISVDAKQMRPLRASAEWCLQAVNQCWTQKASQISGGEINAAKAAYSHARETYQSLIRQAG